MYGPHMAAHIRWVPAGVITKIALGHYGCKRHNKVFNKSELKTKVIKTKGMSIRKSYNIVCKAKLPRYDQLICFQCSHWIRHENGPMRTLQKRG